MTSNYYTLLAIIREIGPKIVGATFLEAYSHRPSELRIRLDCGTIVAILKPISGAIFLSSQEERRPKQNIHPFFEELQGKRLSSISLEENDRIITLEIEDYFLKLSFFGTPNAILSRNGEVIESYKKLQENPNPPREKSAADLLGKRYLREAAARGISPDKLAAMILNSNSAFIHSHNDEILLSLMSLESFRGWTIEKEESINAAVRKVITTRVSLARIGGLRKRLLTSVDSEIERLSHSLIEMQKGVENSERAERYSAIGNAIIQSAYLIEKGANSISILIDEKPFEAQLEPDLSPHQNAARYFEKAKMARAAKDGLRDRSIKSRNEIEKLSAIREQIFVAQDIRVLEQIERGAGLEAPAHAKQIPSGFREFTVFGGMKVLVGRNAKQNDELTMHIAKKEDLWLHARGVAGSHVVLQTGGRKQVPKEAIEQAAELAAFYSEAKTQSLAPVSYTLKKYVRKPKGAGPGAVVMEREEVIMVEPRSG